MNRAALLASALALAGAGFVGFRRMSAERNVAAFLALIRHIEAGDRYDVIAGGDRFSDYSEHPFVLFPNRPRPLGTTAAGAYQMVRQTWTMARDALALFDFSPGAQDQAARWILQYKIPGAWNVIAGGTGNLELVQDGRFGEAIERLRPEWEAFDKMARGNYHLTLAGARDYLAARGAAFA